MRPLPGAGEKGFRIERSMKDRDYHHGNLRDAMIEAAESILDGGGPDTLSLRRLARETGVSQTAPYRHFQDKTALLAAVATRGFEDFGAALTAALEPEPGPEQQLAAIGRAYVNFALDRPGMFRLMFLSDLLASCDDETLSHAATGSFMILAKTVAACRGEEDPVPRDASAVAAWALIHGLAMLCTHDVIDPRMTGGMSRPEVIDAVTRTLISGG